MIETVAAGSAGMMAGLLDRMGQGGAARVRLYASARPSTATLVSVVYLTEPAGVVNSAGELVLSVGVESSVLVGTPPAWGQVFNGNEEHLFDCDARLASAADTGQELVVAAPAGFYAGALLQVQSGLFSALP